MPATQPTPILGWLIRPEELSQANLFDIFAPMSDSSNPRQNAVYVFNGITASLFLLLSLWNLAADATLTTHLLLQSSWALMVLWLFLSAWFFGGLIVAWFPKRIFITASILLILRSSMGWPFSLVTGMEAACHILNVILVALAAGYVVWVFVGASFFHKRPWLRWQHSVIAVAAWMLISVASFATTLFGAATTVNELSNGFVQITTQGISFTEKVLQKDEHRVHLIGLAHIGESDFYSDLKNSFKHPIDGGRLILTEGVTDDNNVLPDGFKSGAAYAGFAEQLGLEEQKSFETGQAKNSKRGLADHGVTFVNADIDISELHPPHLELLVTLLETMESGDLLQSFLASSTIQVTSEELEDFLIEGLIGRRNDHLMEVFESAYRDFEEIYIPWGAAHLPDLERRFLSNGFILISEKKRLGIGFK